MQLAGAKVVESMFSDRINQKLLKQSHNFFFFKKKQYLFIKEEKKLILVKLYDKSQLILTKVIQYLKKKEAMYSL